MPIPHEFVDGVGNTASGAEVSENFAYLLGVLDSTNVVGSGGVQVMTGSYVDIASLTAAVTLDEDSLVLVLATVPHDNSGTGAYFANILTRLLRDATVLSEKSVSVQLPGAGTIGGETKHQWVGQLSAGSYTFKVQGKLNGTGGTGPGVGVNRDYGSLLVVSAKVE